MPGRNIERERSIPDTLDLLHMVPDLLKHAPNLAIAAFDQGHLVPGIGSFLNQADSRRRSSHSPAIFGRDRNASPQLLQRFAARSPRNFHHISLGHLSRAAFDL